MSVNVLARRQIANDFANQILHVIEGLKTAGSTSLTALAQELYSRQIAAARGTKWYASTVKNVFRRTTDTLP